MADPTPLQEGVPIDGYQASLPVGVKARFWRYYLHDEMWLFTCFLLTVVPAVGFLAVWLGSFLFRPMKVKVFLLGVVVCGVGVLLILGGLLLGLLGIWGARYWKKRFPNMLLIPGVITSAKPLRIAMATDVGGGTNYSMLRTADEAHKVRTLNGEKLNPLASFWQLTRGNAESLSLSHRIGTLEPGTEADLTVLTAEATPGMRLRMETVTSLAEELFLIQTLGDDRAVVETYVAGKPSKSVLTI